LRNKVEEMKSLLLENRVLGDKIPKDRWPEHYVIRYGVTNLFKCDLGRDWRMIYTLIYEGAGIAVMQLDVLTHRDYNRRFGYKTT